jgi:hypothetical protein
LKVKVDKTILSHRVQAESNSIKGIPSEAESFTTLSCEPDPPNAPRIANRTKNSLTLQWKVRIAMEDF